MLRNTLSTTLLVACLGLPTSARADSLNVDAGPPSNTWPAYFVGGWGQDGFISQSLAGRFTLDQGCDIQAMQGYLSVNVTGEVLITIYSDNQGRPDAPLFSKTFMSETDQYPYFYGWQGSTGYSGHLDAGTYWIAFGAPDGSVFQVGMGTSPLTAPVMAAEATRANMGTGLGWSNWWVAPQDTGLGVYARIYAAVPEPGSWALWIAGLGLMATAVRRKGEPVR